MKKSIIGYVIILVLSLTSMACLENALTGSYSQESTTSFIVDSNLDTSDIDTSDGTCEDASGNCTLRAAVEQADVLSEPVTITIPTMTITLTTATQILRGTNNSEIAIQGNGAGNTIIEQNPGALTRVFSITKSTNISGLTIRNGNNGNTSLFGGAILVSGASVTLTLSNCEFINNRATAIGNRGGAIYSNNSNISVDTCEFNANLSETRGAAITISGGGGSLTVEDSYFVSNSHSSGSGGAISIDSEYFTISGSTFSGNSRDFNYIPIGIPSSLNAVRNSSFSGVGGISNILVGDAVTLRKMATYEHNTFTGRQALLISSLAEVELGFNIFDYSAGNDCAVSGIGNQYTSLDYNIENGSNTCSLGQPNDLPNTDPLLSAAGLQNNGGPTQTILLQIGSPAKDSIPSGTCSLSTDQRGLARPVNSFCDMGSTEQ